MGLGVVTFATYFATLIFILINNIIIPFVIELFQFFEDHERKSDQMMSLMWRVFFFMVVNMTLIPLMEATAANFVFQ